MVSSTSISFMVVSALLATLVPLGILVFLRRRWQVSYRALAVGALTFFVSQIVLRLPLLNWAGGQQWFPAAGSFGLVLLLALSAGLFEEVARWLGFKFLLAKERHWQTGLALGAGHGGLEAILLVGTAQINNIVISLAINNGTFAATFGPMLGDQAGTIRTLLVETPASHFLAGGLERVFALAIHGGLSVLVLQAVEEGRPRRLLLAITFHALVNFSAWLTEVPGYGLWLAELYLLLLAAAAFIFVRRARLWFTARQVDMQSEQPGL